jgi:hypothetical protein
MSIACPYCQAVLKTKGAKPGQYTPNCPKCGKMFLLVVPEDDTGTLRVRPMPDTKPTSDEPDTVKMPAVKPTGGLPDTVKVPAVPKPKTDKLPVTSARPPVTNASPTAETAVLVKGSGAVKMPPPRAPEKAPPPNPEPPPEAQPPTS